LREYSKDEKEYKAYIQSLKNSVLTAFYTPEVVAAAIQEPLQSAGILPERFLDPSAGTGMFIRGLKDIPEVHCFEKDRLTGKILSSLLFLPISRLEIPECMTGILTGAKMPCANPHLAPYTTTSF
jgi:N-6 DNA methylase